VLQISSGTLVVDQPRPQTVTNKAIIEEDANFAIKTNSTLTLTNEISGEGMLRKSESGNPDVIGK